MNKLFHCESSIRVFFISSPLYLIPSRSNKPTAPGCKYFPRSKRLYMAHLHDNFFPINTLIHSPEKSMLMSRYIRSSYPKPSFYIQLLLPILLKLSAYSLWTLSIRSRYSLRRKRRHVLLYLLSSRYYTWYMLCRLRLRNEIYGGQLVESI